MPLTRKKLVPVWAADEVRRFLSVAEGDKFYALFVLALSTGMRRGELLALKWKDIDFETGVIQVSYTLSKERTLEPTKTEKSQRQIAITDNVLNVLRQHKASQEEEKQKAGEKCQDHQLIFCSRLGTPMNAENVVKRHFNPLIEKAKVRKINFHALRHCCATMALAKDGSLKVISERLGHSTIKTTGDIYSHVSIKMQRSISRKLDEIIFGL